MEIKKGKLAGVYIIQLIPHEDERGFFMRTFDIALFEKASINRTWLQENHSKSIQKGIIRGLHFQLPPFCETKLIRCIRGSILDVFVDLRSNSETFGEWDSIELSASNKKTIFIPCGFAHGFCTLTNFSEVIYKVDSVFSSEHESGIIWNDPDLKIAWPIQNPILSEKDKNNLTFKEFRSKYNSINV